jgi:hypothetical protein
MESHVSDIKFDIDFFLSKSCETNQLEFFFQEKTEAEQLAIEQIRCMPLSTIGCDVNRVMRAGSVYLHFQTVEPATVLWLRGQDFNFPAFFFQPTSFDFLTQLSIPERWKNTEHWLPLDMLSILHQNHQLFPIPLWPPVRNPLHHPLPAHKHCVIKWCVRALRCILDAPPASRII